jgi:Flp pilus assembly protein TadB
LVSYCWAQERGAQGREFRGFPKAMNLKLGNRGASAMAWLVFVIILVVVFFVIYYLVPPIVWTFTLTIPVWIIYIIIVGLGFLVTYLLDREFDIGVFD